jgi:hypothetical protein
VDAPKFRAARNPLPIERHESFGIVPRNAASLERQTGSAVGQCAADGQLAGLERRTTRGGKDSVDHSPGAKDDLANAVAGAIAVGAVPENTVTYESLDSFFAKMNSDNYAMVGGERKYVGPRAHVSPHPTRGLPEWMR